MSRLGHLTEQRKHFVEAYCRLGNGTLSAKEAGYKDSHLVNIVLFMSKMIPSNPSESNSIAETPH